jgi:hypothetical protein
MPGVTLLDHIADGSTSDPVKLYRSVATDVSRRMTCNNMGLNGFSAVASRVDLRLPAESQYQINTTRVHGSRALVVNNSIGAGMSDSAVNAVTKHRSMSSIQAVDTHALNSSSLNISSSSNKARLAKLGDTDSDFEDGGHVGFHKSSSVHRVSSLPSYLDNSECAFFRSSSLFFQV